MNGINRSAESSATGTSKNQTETTTGIDRKTRRKVAALACLVVTSTAEYWMDNTLNRVLCHTQYGQGARNVHYWRLCDHTEPMNTACGVLPNTFEFLLYDLVQRGGLADSRFIPAPEKLAMTLWMLRGASVVRRVALEFQHSKSTVSV
jgi:hypothetical protein